MPLERTFSMGDEGEICGKVDIEGKEADEGERGGMGIGCAMVALLWSMFLIYNVLAACANVSHCFVGRKTNTDSVDGDVGGLLPWCLLWKLG
jgi:hypothetical protein